MYLIRLPIDWVVATEQLSSIGIEEFHGYAAGSVAMATSIDEVDPIKACCIASAFSTLAQLTLIYHVFHLKNKLHKITQKLFLNGIGQKLDIVPATLR